MFVQPPRDDEVRRGVGSCTSAPIAPVLDSVLTITNLLSALYVATEKNATNKDAAVLLGVSFAAFWLSSAVYGFYETSRCSELESEDEAVLTSARSPVVALSTVARAVPDSSPRPTGRASATGGPPGDRTPPSASMSFGAPDAIVAFARRGHWLALIHSSAAAWIPPRLRIATTRLRRFIPAAVSLSRPRPARLPWTTSRTKATAVSVGLAVAALWLSSAMYGYYNTTAARSCRGTITMIGHTTGRCAAAAVEWQEPTIEPAPAAATGRASDAACRAGGGSAASLTATIRNRGENRLGQYPGPRRYPE